MKNIKTHLHWFIGLSSLVSFLFGWMILAHSPKPAQPLAPLPALAPIQDPALQASADTGSPSWLQIFSPRPQRRRAYYSAFVTRGS
jgi:hypothetical protein